MDSFHPHSATNGVTNGVNGRACVDEFRPVLLVFSANTPNSLQEQIRQHQSFVTRHPALLRDVAYTRAVAREALSQRAFAIVKKDFVHVAAAAKAPSAVPPVNVIFSGQGAQWAGMGKELIQTDAQFRADIESMDGILQGLRHPPPWKIMGM